MPGATKTRFAPSPTGFLHLGNARAALFCALFARHTQGIFLLRIEDTDQGRSEHQYTEALQEDLLWMGLGWQEGPVVEGAQGPYLQSQRGEIYHRYFSQLEQGGLAYPCFCSEQELAITRKVQLAAGQAPRYPGTCAALTPAQIETRLAQGLKPTLRFRVPRGETIEFEDLVRGPQRFASDDIGDFIIRRADGTPAFFFGNALDDALMDVTHVLRGEDHLSNTPRQIVLLRALSLRIPEYGHLSLILGSDGTPLSKRHGSHSVRELRDAGYFPAALNNYLARLGHSYDNNNFMTLSELAAEFHIGKIGRSPARFDESQLHFWQQQAIAHAHSHELWEWMDPAVHELVPMAQRDEFIAVVRTNIFLPEHALLWARILFCDPVAPGVLPPATLVRPCTSLNWMQGARQVIADAGAGFFEQALTALQEHPTDFKALAGKIKQALKINGKALYQPLRAALTGELDGPEMARLLPLLGEERARKRLEAALNHCVSQPEK